MAQYTVRLYFETGFNSINIPDGPAMLNGNEATIPPATEFSYLDFPSLDINQERFLPMVRIRASWDVIKNADYCRIGNWYYIVSDIRMTSGDVAELSLIPDFITSAGGVSQLQILDGVTDRVHITDDSFGLYGEEDPYLAPAYDMDVSIDSNTGSFRTGDSYTFIESTVDLVTTGRYMDGTLEQDAIVATGYDTEDVEYHVTYPTVKYIPGQVATGYAVRVGGTNIPLPSTRGQILYYMNPSDSDYELLTNGIAVVRSLGIDQCLSGCFEIPSGMINAPSVAPQGLRVMNLLGTGVKRESSLPFVFGSARNNRIFYGSWTPFTLISASGASVQVKAEEVYASGASHPSVITVADPRREGKPYFRFDPLNGNTVAGNQNDLFRNCVSGLNWRSVPMVFTDKKGWYQEALHYTESMFRSSMNMQQARSAKDLGEFTGVASAIGSNAGVGPIGAAGAAFNYANTSMGRELAYLHYLENTRLERAYEEAEFNINTTVNVPEIRFPMNPDLAGDMMGNGYIVFRPVYKPQDITRLDKVLTAFGYKYTKVLEPTDFTNRRDFNYVRASISVGNLPRWWANGIAAQLSGGVRVWHKRPNPAYYTQNPVAV